MDGWSLQLVLRDFSGAYSALCAGAQPLLPVTRPYGEYLSWLQGQDLALAESYWRIEMAGYQGSPPLWAAPTADCPEGQYAEEEFELKPETTAALNDTLARYRLTPNTAVQGAWALLMGRFSGTRIASPARSSPASR